MSSETPPQESERRQATVLFADISGFTAMAAKTDPEETTTIINRCFERLERIVQDHGGHVDKYIGDAIMALFGVPRAIEHAPKQAINAAIEMRNAVVRLNEEQHLPVRLDIHIGINTGLVLAGHVGGAVKRDFTVVGDAVNIASRLTDIAPKGSIYVGVDTHRYTQHEFEYRSLGGLKVKGKEVPVTAYELLSSRVQVHRPRPAGADPLIGSELVGRERELAQLRAAVCTLTEGKGAVVTVIGEAGLGKSRLMAEAMALPEMGAVMLLEGRSLSVSQGLAFHPFVDLLRASAGIADDDGEQQSLAKLEAAVGILFPDQTGEILPPVATMMGMRLTGAYAERLVGIEGEPLERLIMRSMRELIRRMAAARPLVLVFEDLHWADLSSQKLLEFLLRSVADTAVLFILVARPDPAVERLLSSARQEHRQLLEIPLQPLGQRDCDVLIHNLLKTEEVPYSLRATIARRAEGNPFYIEEVIRSLIDQGVLEHRQGVFRVTGDIEAVVIPGTIEGVIMARVDRLAPQPRRLLQVAAVIGRRFPYRVLAAIVEDNGVELGLRHLVRSQLLDECRTADELEYVFKHALIQETVYGSILQKTCKHLHAAVARSIETLYADRLHEFYGMLAYHYGRAENLEKAEDYLFKAGDEAARSAAPSEALRYFREASRLYFLIHGEGGDPSKKAVLERNIALALFHTGNLTESIEHSDKALALLGEPVRTNQLAVAFGFAADLAGLLWWLYVPIRLRAPRAATEVDREAHALRYKRNLAQMTSDPKRYFVDSIRMFRRLSALDPTGIEHAAGTYAGGGALFAYSGVSFAVSKRFLSVAERLAKNADMRDRFFFRAMHFVYDYLVGNWDDERAIEEELVDEALRHGQVWDTFVYRGLDAERRAHRGDFAGATRQIERLKELSDVYGFFVARSNEYSMSAVLLVEQRRLDAARAMIELYYATQDEEVFHLLALGTKAKIQVLVGDRAGAAETLAKAGELLRRIGRATVYHVSFFLTARLLHDVDVLEASLEGGRGPAARTLARQAWRSVRAAVNIAARVARERVEVYRLAGRLCWLLGRHERALAWWRRSIVAGRALGARPELTRTYAEVGLRLSAEGAGRRTLDGVEAGEYLDMARAQYDELELAWDRAQLAHAGELRAAAG